MSMTFTKLFSSITESSVWMQGDRTRLVWIAMLAMADKHGRVWSSVPGLANRARVPVEAVERALGIFLTPDPFSRTKDFEGRRIEAIDGGWRLLNHGKYRALRDEEDRRAKDAERQRRCRANRHGESVTVTPGHAIADAATEAKEREERAALPPVELPKGFPPTEDEAAKHAAFCGCTEDFARQVWCESAARGGRDFAGNLVVNFRAYLKGRQERERAGQAERRLKGKSPVAAPSHKSDSWK